MLTPMAKLADERVGSRGRFATASNARNAGWQLMSTAGPQHGDPTRSRHSIAPLPAPKCRKRGPTSHQSAQTPSRLLAGPHFTSAPTQPTPDPLFLRMSTLFLEPIQALGLRLPAEWALAPEEALQVRLLL